MLKLLSSLRESGGEETGETREEMDAPSTDLYPTIALLYLYKVHFSHKLPFFVSNLAHPQYYVWKGGRGRGFQLGANLIGMLQTLPDT